MSRYIDADALKEKIDSMWNGRPLSSLGARILVTIDEAPTIETDEPTWEQVKEYCNKRCLDIVDSAMRKQWYKDEPQTERSE